MADRWCKLLARTRASDKISDAVEEGGPDAWMLYSGLMMLHAEFGVSGKLDAKTSRPGRIRNELSAFMLTKDRIAKALAALETCSLIARDKCGAITLTGWGDDVAPTCVRCHKPNHEPSMATCPSCRSNFAKQRAEARRKAEQQMGSGDGNDGSDHNGRAEDREQIDDDRDRGSEDRDEIETDREVSLRDMDTDRDADLYQKGSRSDASSRPPLEAIHSESGVGGVDVSLLGSDRQTRSYASTSEPTRIGDQLGAVVQGMFGRAAQ